VPSVHSSQKKGSVIAPYLGRLRPQSKRSTGRDLTGLLDPAQDPAAGPRRQPVKELPDRQLEHRVPPGGCNFRKRNKDKGPIVHRGMRYDEPAAPRVPAMSGRDRLPADDTAIVAHNVDVQSPWPPGNGGARTGGRTKEQSPHLFELISFFL
jgi:hypothetical protein